MAYTLDLRYTHEGGGETGADGFLERVVYVFTVFIFKVI